MSWRTYTFTLSKAGAGKAVSKRLYLGFVMALAVGGHAVAGPTTRVSVDSAGAEANNASDTSSISANGRFVAFRSSATNLVAGDTNGVRDVFVHDRKKGVTTRVSVDSTGAEANGFVQNASISANGRSVAFESDATNLVAGDTNGFADIFVHDRKKGITTRVSVDSAGAQGDRNSLDPSVNGNGGVVAFESDAANLVAGDTNIVRDVFVHDRKKGITTRVSVDSTGAEANAFSRNPSISANGRFVAFTSDATNLVAGDTNGAFDIFVHDRKTGITSRVNVDSTGAEANANFSVLASISANGRSVAFESDATNLVAGDTNGARDVFVHDRKTGVTTRVSVDSAGAEANGLSSRASIDKNGRFVAFESFATNLVAGDTNGRADIFVHDRK